MSHMYSGLNDLRARVDAKLSEINTRSGRHVAPPAWPSGMRILRFVGGVLLAILVVGWVLSAIN